jgi:tetratricopeptide (TPR) repeat protein
LRIDAKEYEALLRIDALGWTYVEENLLEEAYAEIQKGLEIAAGLEKEEEKQDLLALGFAWQARTKMEEDLSEEAEKLIRKALSMKCRPWIRYRVHMAAGDIDLKEGNSAGALSHYEDAEKEMKEYGIEGHSYQIGPRIGLAYLGVRRYKEAEQKFDELRAFEPIAIGKLYAEYGLALVALEKGKTQHARRLIAEVKTKLSRRTNSNLLLKLIESQEAKLARPVRRAGASKVSSHRRPGPTAGSPP